MKIMFLYVGLLALSLSACARPAYTPAQQAFMDEMAGRPVTCRGAEDCDEKWNKAIEWVVRHSQWGIRKITADTILTNPQKEGGGRESFAEFEVVRYKVGDHTIFHFRSDCDILKNCGSAGVFLKIDFINCLMGLPPGVIQVGPYRYQKIAQQQ